MSMRMLPREFALVLALGSGALLAGCKGVPLDMGMGAAPAGGANRAVVVAGPPFTPVERDLVTRIAAKGMYEIEVSRLAAERALSNDVRSFAQTMVQQHSQANNELVALMAAHGVAPPKALAADRADKLHRLAALPRSDAFDNGYVRVVGIEDHRAAIAMLEKARRDVRDRDLRAWLDRTLTTLRSHLAMAQSLAAAMSG